MTLITSTRSGSQGDRSLKCTLIGTLVFLKRVGGGSGRRRVKKIRGSERCKVERKGSRGFVQVLQV